MNSKSIILNEQDLRDAVAFFKTQASFTFDVEAQGEYRDVSHLADLSWISLATKGTAIVVPFNHPIGDRIIGETKVEAVYGPKAQKAGQKYWKSVPLYEDPPSQISPGVVFRILEPLFSDPGITKIGHDVVYDLSSVARYFGFVPVPPYDDTKIDFWLLNENRMRNGLKEWTEEYYGLRYDYENIGKCVEKHPFSTVAYYSYCDAKYTWLHYLRLIQEIKEQGLKPVHDMEMQLLNTMVGMRLVGARVDLDRLHSLSETLGKEAIETEKSVYAAAGKPFNVNSNRQKQTVLYEEQKLRPWKLTKGGLAKKKLGQPILLTDYSVDDEVLESYPDNPVAFALREYGDISKLLSTYVNGYLGDGEKPGIIYDGHIHAGFMQYGTVTGRFSCRAPNLQNIPRPHSPRGNLIRGIFIAEEGGKLVVADYGQIELVVLAHYVGEGKLYEGFMAGIDPHTMTAAMILDKAPEDVTKVERQDMGKTMNFAIVYGAGIYKVASMAHITPEEAKRKLKKHAEMFPEIHDFRSSVIDTARRRQPTPYITTLLGRKRRITELNSNVEGIRKGAERQLFNSLIQGGAADLLKLSMIRIDSVLPPEIQLILTVHDEIVLSAPDGMAQEAADMLKEAMTGEKIQRHVRVPLLADVKIVNRWSDAK
jgi:DNA polymerase I-like protein with 3'-5' exonuclease and polymerase domains